MSSAPCNNWTELQSLVRDRYAGQSKRLQQVSEFVLENPNTIAFETIAVIAEQIGVPPSTLIRFSSSLGFEGFNDLKEVVKTDVLANTLNYGRRIDLVSEKSDWNPDTLLPQLVAANQEALGQLEASVTPAQIQRITDLMSKAENIFILGSGRAHSVAAYLYYALSHAGARSFLLNSGGGMQREELSHIRDSDLLIAVSFSPYASNTVSLAETIAKQGTPTVALTDAALSPLSNFSEETLYIQEGQINGFRSLAATMLVGQVLALSLADKKR